MLDEMGAVLTIDPQVNAHVRFAGDEHLASCFAVTELAVASIGSAAAALAALVASDRDMPTITVDRRLVSLWIGRNDL